MERTFQTNRFLLMLCSVLLLLLAFRTASAQTGSNSSGVTSDDQSGVDDDQRSSIEKGMEPFYNFVKSFLGVVQPNRLADQSWLNLSQLVKGDYDEDEISDWKNWAEYLMGFVVCVALGVLFFLVMPIAGLVFCCCRCAGKCGGKPKPQDPKHARCKRTTYCTLLLVLNTVALAGVVCAFLSNEIVYDKLQNLNSDGPTGKIIKSADTVNTYTNDTIEEIEEKILQNFVDSSVRILESIGESAVDAVDGVLETLNVDELLFNSRELAKGVIRSLDDIANVAKQLEFLNAQGALLTDNLTEIKGELDGLCTPPSQCPGYDSTQYTLEANFTGLSELEEEANNLNDSVNLAEEIIVAEESINSTKNETTQSVQANIDSSKDSVNEVETSLRDGVNDIKKNLQDVVTAEVDKFRSKMEDLQDDIADYSEYVWYAGLGICCALLLVVVVYYVGILFGLCGERPGYGAQFCNTGAGANFLLAGVGMTFLLTWLIMLVCMVLFVVGGPMYTELCRYFDGHHPRELKPFNDALFDALDWQDSLFNGKDVDLDIVNVLEECKNDEAIYSALRLDYMVNLTEVTDLSAMHDALDELKNETLNIPDVTVVTPAMNESISNYAKAGLEDIAFDQYYAEINKSVTPVDLQEMATQVRSYTTTPGLPQDKKDSLNSIADRLVVLRTQYAVPMQEAEESLEESITSLKERADAGIESTTNALLGELLDAQEEFNRNKDKLVKDEVDKLIDDVMAETESLVNLMLHEVHNNIGKCRPVYDSFYTVSDAACIAALEPLNAVWFSIGWCLFFFVPALIFAVKLAGLYRREHEERDFDDPKWWTFNSSFA